MNTTRNTRFIVVKSEHVQMRNNNDSQLIVHILHMRGQIGGMLEYLQ